MGKKNRTGIPIVDDLIDLAGMYAMYKVSEHMENKYHYKKKGKINPYRASTFAMGMGRLNSIEDVAMLGGALGAAGSFDVDADDRPRESENQRLRRLQYTVPEDPLFRTINYETENDNRYVWRLRYQGAASCGLNPFAYETEEAYLEAVNSLQEVNQEEESAEDNTEDENFFYVLRTSNLKTGENKYYVSPSRKEYKVGEIIKLPSEAEDAEQHEGVVLSIEKYATEELEQLLKEIGPL